MATGEAASDRWRDEDGVPSPAEELTDWWLKLDPPPEPLRSYPQDHEVYLHELYDEIEALRKRVKELEAASEGQGSAEAT